MNESIKVGKPNRWLHRNLGIVNTIIKSYGAWAHFNNEAFNLQFNSLARGKKGSSSLGFELRHSDTCGKWSTSVPTTIYFYC